MECKEGASLRFCSTTKEPSLGGERVRTDSTETGSIGSRKLNADGDFLFVSAVFRVPEKKIIA